MKKKLKLKMDFISSATLDEKDKNKRINLILDKVKDGTILVTDGVLKPDEEMELIKETMRRVDNGFPGIEVCSLKKQTKGLQALMERFAGSRERIQNFLAGLTGKKQQKSSLRTGLTFIGPARFIKKIKKNPNSFSVSAEV